MSAILNQHDDYHAVSQAHYFPLLVKSLLYRARAVANDERIYYADKSHYTYREFFARINRLANVLMGLGLQGGDIVAVMDWDTPRYLELYFAVPMCGLVLQTVNVRLSPDKVLYTLNHARPKALFLNAEFAPMVANRCDDVPSLEHVVWMSDDGTPIPNATKTSNNDIVGEYEALLAAASPTFDFPDFDENTIATTFYTSGTTGDPKGVFFTHRQLVLHTLGLVATVAPNCDPHGIRYSDVYMPLTPLFHVHAWGAPYLATMLGLKQIYPGRYLPARLVDLIEQHRVTFTHGVPAIVQMLLKEMTSRGGRFNGLKMLVGGSRLTEGLARAAVAQGIEVAAAYGMSETAPIIATATFRADDDPDPDQAIQRRIRTGTPAMLTEIHIWGEGDQRQPQDGRSAGELVVRAPWLTQSYYKNRDAGESLWQGGYLHTQDIAHMDAQGNVQITDRLKDVIKTGGEWVSSLEIETILSLHPSVADIAVIGVPDDRWGERPLAIVALKPDHANTNAEDILALGQQAAERGLIAKYAIPSELKILPELPKTSVGKLDKKVMRQMFAAGLYG